MSVTLLSPAKINLFLSITSQRTDGYHNLETLFQLLDVGDTLSLAQLSSPSTVKNTDPNIVLTFSKRTQQNPFTHLICEHPKDSNLIIKAANQLIQHAKDHNLSNHLFDVEIEIDKILPLGAGLGGGSSNAATTLIALNHLWQLGLDKHTLAKIGLRIGADVPIFIDGHSAFATGVGEEITPVVLDNAWYVLIFPNTPVSTAGLFNDPDLIRTAPIRSYEEWQQTPYHNIFEPLARKHYPEIDKAINWLNQYSDARMTGTGSTIFARFDNKQSASEVLESVPRHWWSTVSQGVNYWHPLEK